MDKPPMTVLELIQRLLLQPWDAYVVTKSGDGTGDEVGIGGVWSGGWERYTDFNDRPHLGRGEFKPNNVNGVRAVCLWTVD